MRLRRALAPEAAAPVVLTAVPFPPFLLGKGTGADGKTGLKMQK